VRPYTKLAWHCVDPDLADASPRGPDVCIRIMTLPTVLTNIPGFSPIGYTYVRLPITHCRAVSDVPKIVNPRWWPIAFAMVVGYIIFTLRMC
jgi:hypothetical protein